LGTHTMTAEHAREVARELLEFATESEAIAERKRKANLVEQTRSACGNKSALELLMESTNKAIKDSEDRVKQLQLATPTQRDIHIYGKSCGKADDDTQPLAPARRRKDAERQILINSVLSPRAPKKELVKA